MKRPLILTLTVTIIALFCISGIQFWLLLARQSPAASPGTQEASSHRDHVALSSEKFAAVGIEVATAQRRELCPQRTVPGHIEYNATRHVLVKSPFDGLIRKIDVNVGDRVTEGQVIAVIDSPELGERRADVLLRQSDLEHATNEHDWWHSLQANLDELVSLLKRPQQISQLEKDFAEKPLGDYRQQILGAYSRMRLDEELSNNVKSAAESGGVSKRAKLELDSARDTATAKFAAACEQATFDVKQMHHKAESALKDAERRLAVAKQRHSMLVSLPTEKIPADVNDASLSTWPVKAPFTATVEEILLAPKERIQTADGLIQLADTTHLWVQADIRERDWPALTIKPGQSVSVQTPALPGKTLEATVAFVGRTVSQDTRSVPLTADIDNQNGLLRPGMFVRVLLPDGTPRECLTVPQSAIATNDGHTFVFIEARQREYSPREVKTNLSVDPWIEITSGLEPGDRIVTAGTATLKAELLLEAEE